MVQECERGSCDFAKPSPWRQWGAFNIFSGVMAYSYLMIENQKGRSFETSLEKSGQYWMQGNLKSGFCYPVSARNDES